MAKAIAVRSFKGTITRFEKLTHDIRGIEIEIDQPIKFWAGQYVDITVTTEAGETITRSFSMANPPSETKKLHFIIKKYPDGKFSGQLDNGGIAAGADVKLVGPYGTCFRREDRDGALILVAAGSGMSPIWSILHDHLASGEERPVYFFYGARTQRDLFHLERIAALVGDRPEVTFIPVLSHEAEDADWARRARLRPRARRRQAQGAGPRRRGRRLRLRTAADDRRLESRPVHERLRARADLLRQVHAVCRFVGRMSARPTARRVT